MPSLFTVVICTRERQEHLRDTLTALGEQTVRDFPVMVIDQSDALHPELKQWAGEDDRRSIVQDHRRGLSCARNLALERVDSAWLVFLDDDCHPEPDWAAAFDAVLRANPDVGFVSGHVGELNLAPGGVTAATIPVADELRVAGRWERPSTIGYGVCMAVRRSVAQGLGGWDERLGPGVVDFPASDDIDFNYRFLRSGATALLSPMPRAHHDQWRSGGDLVRLYRGYAASWAGFSIKHVRSGDLRGGLWLWSFAVRDVVRMFASSARHRSPLRFRVAVGMLRGSVVGTRKALLRSWAEP